MRARQLQIHSASEREGASSSWLLGHGIRNLLRCDEAEVVSGIASYVMTQHASLRTGSALMERCRRTPLPAVAALMGFMTRFLEVREPKADGDVIWVARLGNERRAIQSVIEAATETKWAEVTLRRPPDAAAWKSLAVAGKHGPKRILQIARHLHRSYPYFRVLRALELVGYYAAYLGIFRKRKYQAAVMSSHSNPHGIAFNLAARRSGVPVVLVTHGMPISPIARLRYDMAIVHSEAARRSYVEEGCELGRVLVHGRRQEYRPMPQGQMAEQSSVGIFLCKDVNEETLRATVKRLLEHPRVSRVLIRPHPKNLYRGLSRWVEELMETRVQLSSGAPVVDDLTQVELVLAGNSSVLVDAVTAGRPAIYVPHLDHGPYDMHRFVEKGLVCDLARELDPDSVLRFFQRRDWPSTLRLFANIDEDESDVLREVSRFFIRSNSTAG